MGLKEHITRTGVSPSIELEVLQRNPLVHAEGVCPKVENMRMKPAARVVLGRMKPAARVVLGKSQRWQ